jgi:predicted hotdog family 3-hydroxylacyl-ACP dehydratase
MRLDQTWIQSHIPHHGRMCLLDEVLDWDTERVSCRGATHRDLDHPLRKDGQLGIACGIEYAAQAMAVHGALTALGAGAAPGVAPAGFLAALRNVRLHALRLDDVAGDLICIALRAAGDHRTALYEFELRSDAGCLLSGRATVVLEATQRLQP